MIARIAKSSYPVCCVESRSISATSRHHVCTPLNRLRSMILVSVMSCCVSGSRCIRRGKPEECFIRAPETDKLAKVDEDEALSPVLPASGSSAYRVHDTQRPASATEYEHNSTVETPQLSIQDEALVLYQNVPEKGCLHCTDHSVLFHKRIQELPNKV